MSTPAAAGAWLLAITAGAVVAWALARTATGLLNNPVLQQRNHRGVAVSTAGGVLLVLSVLTVDAARAGFAAFGLGDRPGDFLARMVVLAAALGFGALGLLDDVAGTGEHRGFRGHLRALSAGVVTTGLVKLAGGGALALIIAAAPDQAPGWRVVLDACLIALAANLGNLLDRGPGRAIKGGILVYLPLAPVLGSTPAGIAVAPVVGAALGLLRFDLRERLMLGDAGANVLGAALGVGVVIGLGPSARTGVLVALVVLNAAAEAVSFSSVIERNRVLRRLDRMGRMPA